MMVGFFIRSSAWMVSILHLPSAARYLSHVNTHVLTSATSRAHVVGVPVKTEQLQIRVTRQQKASLRRRARAAGVDVSTFVLSRVLPPLADRLADILTALVAANDHRYALAELSDFLHATPPVQFRDAVADASVARLSPMLQNHVAAMVEHAANVKGVAPPAWARDVPALPAPHFATSLRSLRIHLLLASPVAFKRRNIFVDASVGARV